MKKITITIEDKPEGGVSVKVDPKFEELAKAIDSGYAAGGAIVYALRAINAISTMNKQANSRISMPISIPDLLR